MNDIGVPTAREVTVYANEAPLPGKLHVPPEATGIVLFAHGSGSSRFSHRNRFVAGALRNAGLATLLFDLLTEEENQIDSMTAELRFDIPLLTGRLGGAVQWVQTQDDIRRLPIGLFGASTGAAAALSVAARAPDAVRAVVSRGGRPDLAGDALGLVTAPTLLIVGADDTTVLALNNAAQRQLPQAELAVVPGATHLFEEPHALEQVANLARDWFRRHLIAAP
jgi:pimeloyl-ACP methyl ester carboxylesterase